MTDQQSRPERAGGAEPTAKEVLELRKENERLREEVERLRAGVFTPLIALPWAVLLPGLGTLLDASVDYRATLSSVARLIVPTIADWCFIDLLEEDGQVVRVEVAHADPSRQALAERLRRRGPRLADENPICQVIRTGTPQAFAGFTGAQRDAFAQDGEHLELLREVGPTSVMVVPLVARGRTLGTLTFLAAESARRYGSMELAFAEELGRHAALAVDNSRLYEAERQAREAAERAEQRFRAAVEAMLDCFGLFTAVRDAQGRIVDFRADYVSSTACSNHRLSREEQSGRSIREIFPGPAASGIFDAYRRVVETGEPLDKSGVFYEDGGQERALELRAVKQGDGIAVTWRDVTQSEQLHRAVRESEQRSLESQKRLEALLRDVAEGVGGDLSDLLSVILTSALTLLKDSPAPRQARLGERILSCGNRMKSLLHVLHDHTRLSLGGQLRLARQPADLDWICRAAVAELRRMYPQRRIDYAPGVDGRGHWDGERVGQVIQLLLLGALESSPADAPVRLGWRRNDVDAPRVEISVQAESEPGAGGERWRAGREEDREQLRVRLGLSVAGRIAQAHGGGIARAEEGATFTFVLPVRAPDGA